MEPYSDNFFREIEIFADCIHKKHSDVAVAVSNSYSKLQEITTLKVLALRSGWMQGAAFTRCNGAGDADSQICRGFQRVSHFGISHLLPFYIHPASARVVWAFRKRQRGDIEQLAQHRVQHGHDRDDSHLLRTKTHCPRFVVKLGGFWFERESGCAIPTQLSVSRKCLCHRKRRQNRSNE